jgi:hypothetical protein
VSFLVDWTTAHATYIPVVIRRWQHNTHGATLSTNSIGVTHL